MKSRYRFTATHRLPLLALTAAVAAGIGAPAQAYELLGDWPTKFKTASGTEYGVRGTIQYDINHFSDDSLPNGNARFDDLETWRRKEVYLYARRTGQWELAAGYDFQAHVWVDAYFKLINKTAGDFRLGQIKTPVGFEEGAIGSGSTTFLERSLPVQAVNQGRRIGLDWTYENVPGWLLNAAVFNGGDLNGDNDGTTWAARAVYNPVKTDTSVVHIGFAGSIEERDDEIARIRARPEANLTTIRLIDTGNLSGADQIKRVGIEGAWSEGPFSLQGEFLTIDASRRTARDYTAEGAYLYASWILTGETRPYKSGAFANVKPKNDYGAVELGLRYSTLDLNDGIIYGGKQHDWTLGVNWYLGQHFKLQANYIRAFSDKGNLALDPKITEVRAQVHF
ncbi:phosphate-selective porin OprO/OprP [Tahibacter aquaticus]|uniref:Phosphate-selective porin OprO/OprP n=1 Tax=Tahibacter aquaticus TaxID=520092 RepID=A0A4V3DNI5_9GAMM|nr:porin [Tahibacter aquaticus]TDR48516.1 phosphate-selective porin OprO/OprP [Tahibacter aquaticus]